MNVLVIVPCYNEEASIKQTIEGIRAEVPDMDFIIINDNSQDNTRPICIQSKYPVISLPMNLGIGGAMQTGYIYALRNGYDIVIQVDGDNQHDPRYIKEMLKILGEGAADIVIGSRFIDKKGYQSTIIRRMGISFLSLLIYCFSGVRILDATSGFRAINREYIELFAKSYAQDYPEPESLMEAILKGAKIVEIPVVMHERFAGVSSIHQKEAVYYMVKVSLSILIHRIFKER